MSALFEFLSSNAAVLLSILALLMSLQANRTARAAHMLNLQNRAKSESLLFNEKRRELLNEVDRQHAHLSTLMMITAQKILLFHEQPDLQKTMPRELSRLMSNLRLVEDLAAKYAKKREYIESIGLGAGVEAQEGILAEVKGLTISIEKDIAHERDHLEDLRRRLGK